MNIIKLSIFDLVDSPRLAKMVYFVQQVLPEVTIEEIRLNHFPFDVIEPLFLPSDESFDYMTRFAMAIMITHVEETKDVPAFSLDKEDVDHVLFGMLKETTYIMADAMDMPKGLIPEDCKHALSTALVKWDKGDPLSNVSTMPGSAKMEAKHFMDNAIKASKDHLEKNIPDQAILEKAFKRMKH